MDSTKRSNFQAVLLGLASMGIYATHDVVIKVLGERYPAAQVLFFAALLSFPLMSMILLHDPTNGTLRPKQPFWVALRSGCIMLCGLGAFYAFSVLPLAQIYAILFSSPLLVTVLAIPVLGERVDLHLWLAVCAGLAGVLVVVQPGTTSLNLGHLAALASAFATALAAVVTRRLGRSERTMILLMWPMLGNFALSGTLLTVNYAPMTLPDLSLAGVIAILGLVAGFLQILSYQKGEAVVVAPMQYSQILWAMAYGWFLFGERIETNTLIGAGLIIASGLYIVQRESREGTSYNRLVMQTRMRPETVTTPRSSLLGRAADRFLK